jgi:hypothetical protein
MKIYYIKGITLLFNTQVNVRILLIFVTYIRMYVQVCPITITLPFMIAPLLVRIMS